MTGTLGAIADDFTGATDVAVAFRRGGLRTLLFFGVPPETEVLPTHDAIVIALKSRAIPAEDAVSSSLEALRWLRNRKAEQIYFKYCSTFDSTPHGNIGPVLDALSRVLSSDGAVMTPSSPEHGRTQYQGHLFVGETLLAESPMRDHPATPMTDSHLPRLLRAQTTTPVDLVTHDVVRRGETAVREAIYGKSGYVLVDALTEDDLRLLGRVVVSAPLVAGAAGLAAGLAAARASATPLPTETRAPAGPAVVLSGSCSARTLEQVAVMLRLGRPAHRLDPVATPDPDALAAEALAWYDSLTEPGPLVYSSSSPAELKRTQEELGVERSAGILEKATGLIALGLAGRGVRRLVAAGGETSGAIVTALDVRGGVIGAEAAPGVPWIHPVGDRHPALLLKSGNFGDPDLLATASAS
ncbi:3-oxo-tetronate kinase [Amycolatopsis sp. BJA-103]|uniref:3-oxo-tetronate kinase n=1 Tax=Amycolatopsis sp. BJA-103 TaxID=1911175 RepID=UPI000C76296A|nr:3-oxo-tetronate kinase [Amycolatopsis sp. BJA-103]AUI58868.1 Hrp-dependent type III effector protein [Amycolatopsis sp. BJA-103]PNE17681.1 Hrp-dependent type III effector protein [Amycolatopsis sp. BJA-103]